MNPRRCWLPLALACSCVSNAFAVDPPYVEKWEAQFGERATLWTSVDVTAGGTVYTGGYMGVGSSVSGAFVDGLLAKYDQAGNELWSRQLGSGQFQTFVSEVAGNKFGGVYAVGQANTERIADFGPFVSDAFLANYDSDGNRLWSYEFGTEGGSSANGIGVGADGSAYIVGQTVLDPRRGDGVFVERTSDAFLKKVASNGTLAWSIAVGLSDYAFVTAVSIGPDESIYVGGTEFGEFEGSLGEGGDAFVTKYSPDGAEQWTSIFGTSQGDTLRSIAIDGTGEVYAVGASYTSASVASDLPSDGFLSKLADNGEVQWTELIDNDYSDLANSVAIDPVGNIVVAGSSGQGAGFYQAVFIAKYDSTGQRLGLSHEAAVSQWPPRTESAESIDFDSVGNLYVAGWSNDFPGSFSFRRAKLTKYNAAVPEPTSACLMAFAFAGVLRWRR